MATCCALLVMVPIYYWAFKMVNRAVCAVEDIRDAVVQMAQGR